MAESPVRVSSPFGLPCGLFSTPLQRNTDAATGHKIVNICISVHLVPKFCLETPSLKLRQGVSQLVARAAENGLPCAHVIHSLHRLPSRLKSWGHFHTMTYPEPAAKSRAALLQTLF
jgi:hypothetical protein